MAAEKDKQRRAQPLSCGTLFTRTGSLLFQNPQPQQMPRAIFYFKTEKCFVPHPDKALTLVSTPPHGEQSVWEARKKLLPDFLICLSSLGLKILRG